MRLRYLFMAAAVTLLAGAALAEMSKAPMRNYPIVGGSYDPIITTGGVAGSPHATYPSTLDVIGDVYTAGNTWYDLQHNGTAGRMLALDNLGMVHMVWTRGDNQSLSQRHVRYNVWDPGTYDFLFDPGNPTGMQIDQTYKAGFIGIVTTPNGYAIPAFHQTPSASDPPLTAVGMDWAPAAGAFTISQPLVCNEGGLPLQLIWPKMVMGRDSNVVHAIAIESSYITTAGYWQRFYYARGVPVWQFNQQTQQWNGVEVTWQDLPASLQPQCGQFWEVDTVMTIAPTIIASQRSDRICMVWAKSRTDLLVDSLRSQSDNDLYYRMSEDAGLNWGPETNITQFIYPIVDCPGTHDDTLICDKDTFRVYTDCAAIFDNNDNLHVAFSTMRTYQLTNTWWPWKGDIWHWDEVNQVFANVATLDPDAVCWDVSHTNGLGDWQLPVQRPCMALDSITGYIYMSYQWYNPQERSEGGWPMADAMVSVSTDNGYHWSESTNVTDTQWRPIDAVDSLCYPAPADSCTGERDITLAEFVTYADGDGYLHMEYELDLDAGTSINEEGVATLNPIIYQRIPIDSIATLPLHDIGYPVLHSDGSNAPEAVTDRPVPRPETFALYQNYPNPFNPTTEIQFDLPRDARVTLKVFNVMGQEVSTLIGHEALTAGAKTVSFDGSNLASGVYVYRLEVNGKAQSRKMILMK